MPARRKSKASHSTAAHGRRNGHSHRNGHAHRNGHVHGEGSARLGHRPAWQGHLRLSLVSCPVALFNATTRANDVSFHLINPETNNRIRMVATDPETGPVNRTDLVKGYQIEKNRYVVVSNDELESVRLETTKTIDIERFVDANSIDRLFWNDPYFLLPNGKEGEEAYGVIRDALADTGRIALGRVVMHTRERLVALEPRDKGIIAYTLRMRNEVVDPKTAFDNIPAAKADRSMIDIAEKIIEQQEGPFEPSAFRDRYEAALRELIERKERGEKAVTAPPPEKSNVIDLMDALRRSLKKKGELSNEAPARGRAKRRSVH